MYSFELRPRRSPRHPRIIARNSITWFGQLLKEIHAVWPRFKLSCDSGISWTGASPVDKVETLGRRFSAAIWQSRWLDRQLSVLSKRPQETQQDFLFFACTQGKSSGLQSNTKASSAAVHNKNLLAVGPEKLQTEGTEKRYGVTETYKALPRKDIFRTLSVVERNASK